MSSVELDRDRLRGLISEKYGTGGQAQFARDCDVSRQYINGVISGALTLTGIDRIAQFAQILGVSIEDLLIIPKELAQTSKTDVAIAE